MTKLIFWIAVLCIGVVLATDPGAVMELYGSVELR